MEAIDIMPTLLEEAGLPIKPCPVSHKVSRPQPRALPMTPGMSLTMSLTLTDVS